jgi:hypothetical protein
MERLKYIDFGRNHGTGRMDQNQAEEEGLSCRFELEKPRNSDPVN